MNTHTALPDKIASLQPTDFKYLSKITDKGTDLDAEEYILIIDPRALDRECLSRSLSIYNPAMNIVTAGSIEEWRKRHMTDHPSAILLVFSSRKPTEADACDKIKAAAETFRQSPVIVIADSDDLGDILKAVECGARGYIPTSVNISVAAEAIALARAGGVFIPASSILAKKDVLSSVVTGSTYSNEAFTPREIEVAEALRRGKANKIIAYEMNLCESTVKVHIRNIMKKLNATNRTEVAFKLK
ncbi:response regulator transcription factor [Rhizobium cremeum]|uniref:response regulator transcription factor n=1 Tax=Rhizobium cremeum TaxID=2813827 RepID=UPI000DDE193B|nr:response regulator transcription factor [Rhizobium cremeum]MCJ7997677.1 response regulator transcription factor [Rhizobium cremeum]MCJ8002771.1 response regulator transcription factor [Rhizobium cremeum]